MCFLQRGSLYKFTQLQEIPNKCCVMCECSLLYTFSRIEHTCLEFYIKNFFSNFLEINLHLVRNYYFQFFIVFNYFLYLLIIILISLNLFLSIFNYYLHLKLINTTFLSIKHTLTVGRIFFVFNYIVN